MAGYWSRPIFSPIYQEGELLGLAVYSSCPIAGNRINYAVTSGSSGRLISWGQEHLVERSPSTDGLIQLSLRYSNSCITTNARETYANHCDRGSSIPIAYEMIPRVIVTVFFPRDDRHLVSGSLDVAVRADFTQSKVVSIACGLLEPFK